MTHISSLKLHNFRCYESAALGGLAPGLVVLSGPNGAGKTNVLEAVSLLTPGKGLRGAGAMEMQRRDSPNPWAVAAAVYNGEVEAALGTGLEPRQEKRTVRINGRDSKTQAALAEYLSAVWLTPQMDGLFIGAARERRKFLDRLVFAFDPGHSGRCARYENAMAQRSRILRDGPFDADWLNALEAQMAETGIAIAAARLDFVQRLQQACDRAEDNHFPRARVQVAGTIESLMQNTTALEAETMFAYQLRESRARDSETGGAVTGPHRSDLHVRFAAKDMPAAQCSTGEQKALLIGIVLAHARLSAAEKGAPPVLLLDEVAAHLDESRRAALYDLLQALGGQAWLTGTEEKLFTAIRGSAQFFHVEDAAISPQKESQAA